MFTNLRMAKTPNPFFTRIPCLLNELMGYVESTDSNEIVSFLRVPHLRVDQTKTLSTVEQDFPFAFSKIQLLSAS